MGYDKVHTPAAAKLSKHVLPMSPGLYCKAQEGTHGATQIALSHGVLLTSSDFQLLLCCLDVAVRQAGRVKPVDADIFKSKTGKQVGTFFGRASVVLG